MARPELTIQKEAFQVLSRYLEDQGECLTEDLVKEEYRFTYIQCKAYVATALYRLEQAKKRLIPDYNPEKVQLSNRDSKVKNQVWKLICKLQGRLMNIAQQADFIPMDSEVDPGMFCFPAGFISPIYGRVGKPEGKHLERYRIWLDRQKNSGITCGICQKNIFCRCCNETDLPAEKRTCFVSRVYPSLNIYGNSQIHICSSECDVKFTQSLNRDGLKQASYGKYTIVYDPKGMTHDEAVQSIRDTVGI